jgi:ferric-dicitrate binding protein FerR (iron transport regulator)
MNMPKYSARAARVLAAERRVRSASAAARERGITTMQRALADARRRTVRRRAFGAGLAAAAAVGIWFGLSLTWSSSVEVVAFPVGQGGTVVDAVTAHRLESGSEVTDGGRVSTAVGGGARLELSTGTELRLDQQSALAVERSDEVQRFRLSEGALHAKVAKLGPGDRFIVATPDSEIEVRGTQFQLDVVGDEQACADGLRTRLRVTEGVVEVRHGGQTLRVAAGGHWPEQCEPPAPSQDQEVTADSAVPPEPAQPEAPAVSVPQHHAAPKAQPELAGTASSGEVQAAIERASALREQNELFSKGLQAKDQGDNGVALRAFGQLLERYPHSALAESALAGRMRILAGRDPVAARRAAERYLRGYPQGFARSEAEGLLSNSDGP